MRLARTRILARCKPTAAASRLLSSAPGPLEPSETADPSLRGLPSRARELLQPPAPQGKYKALGVAGASITTGAIGVLGVTHYQALLPFLPDIVGLTALFCGGSMLAIAAKELGPSEAKPKAPGKVEWQLELIPLNDEKRYAAATDILARGLSDSKAVPGATGAFTTEIEGLLKKAEAEHKTFIETTRTERVAKLTESVKQQLQDGVPARRVRQQLSPRVFVLDFDTRQPAGGLAKRPPTNRELVDTLREQVSLLLGVASPYDEVVLRVTSPGGPVTDYGLAAAQFARLKEAGIRTTACVDLVAASGGYMLACAADRIIAAPFSILGSIGVIASVPNVHQLLERGGVEFVQRTAGRYKRTINVFTPNTEEGLQKFDEELALIHQAFISHVSYHRPSVDTARVCTGETWLALHAQEHRLVDTLSTSDQYLRSRQHDADVFLLTQKAPKKPTGLLTALKGTSDVLHAFADKCLKFLASPLSRAGVGRHVPVQGLDDLTETVETPLLRAPSSGGALNADAARVQ